MYTYDQIISDIKKKIYKPVYYLMGEESFFIDSITRELEKNVLPEDEKSFNQTVLYGKDIDLGTLLNTARRFPMMSNYNVVIVKEAQNLKGIDGVPSKQTDPFLMYVENAPETTILIINYKAKPLARNKKLYKALDKNAVLFESKSLYENKVGQWIVNFIKNKGYSIDIRAAELMASHLGTNLSKVVNEIEKLLIVVPNGTHITQNEIEEHIGISKDFNIFELQNALGKKDVYRANLIITHLGQNPKTKSIIPLISFLYAFFTKILMIYSTADKSRKSLAVLLDVKPYFVQDYLTAARNYTQKKCFYIIGFLREYDTKSKGIDAPSVDDAELMRELIYKILHI